MLVEIRALLEERALGTVLDGVKGLKDLHWSALPVEVGEWKKAQCLRVTVPGGRAKELVAAIGRLGGDFGQIWLLPADARIVGEGEQA